MAPGQLHSFLRRVHTSLLAQDAGGMTDARLLGLFLERRDEAAFEALVRRHGPMVWGVCRRLLSNHHDAEDAFQATFLVLVRKARSVVPRGMVGNWLHGVAYRTALRARGTAARIRAREKQVRAMPEPEVGPQDPWRDLQPVLDEELDRLPAKYRAAVVLCDLEGKTYQEAARLLGWPVGTLSTRLTRGRKLLADRLARRGLTLAGAVLTALLSQKAVPAAVPASLVVGTVRAASQFVAGQAAATGPLAANVAALMEGVVKTMLLSKLKLTTLVVLVMTVAAAGTGGLLYRTRAAERATSQKPPDRRTADRKSVDQNPAEEEATDLKLVPQLQRAQPDEERKKREERHKKEEDEKVREEARRLREEQRQMAIALENRRLHELFSLGGRSHVDVFLDGATQRPFIRGASFGRVVEVSGRKFFVFFRKADGKEEKLLIDAARITGVRVYIPSQS